MIQILQFKLMIICFTNKMNNFVQKQLKLSLMNNQYQNQQPRQNEQRYSPPYQMHKPQNVQNQVKGVNQQGIKSANNAYSGSATLPTSSNAHQQLFQQYANPNSSQYGNKVPESSPTNQENQPAFFPPPQPQKGLIQPPQLRQQEPNNQARNSQGMSQQNQTNQNQVREMLWGQQQQANTFWQQKFFLIYQKFQWFGSRFQMLKSQYTSLSEQLVRVDSQQDWNQLKHHHQEFAQKLQQMFQQLIAVADQNQQLINQRLQQDDGVWQRRYHQLLSNFKALQEKSSTLEGENLELKNNQQQDQNVENKQNYPQLLSHYQSLQEEYQKLFNAYNKLQEENDMLKTSSQQEKQGPSMEDFQNMRNQYQRTLEAISNQNQGLKSQCQAFYQQNQQFRQQLNTQAQTLAQLQHMNMEIQQKSAFIHQLTEQLSHWKDNYHLLESHQNDILSKEALKTQQATLKHQRQLETLNHELQTKESQCSVLSKRINDQLRAREHLVKEHHEQLQKAVRSEGEKQMRLRGAIEKQLKTVHEEFQKLHTQTSQNEMARYQLDGLKKKILYMTEENQQLLKSMSAKNQELAALRSVSLQVSTYENILQKYKALEKEKMTVEEVSRKQHTQLLNTRKKLSQAEHEFTQYKTITSSSSLKASSNSQLKQLQSELQTQTSQRSKLQSQINKYKQLIEVKQRYIQDLQEENFRTLVKLQHSERVMNVMKEEHNRAVETLKGKMEQLESRNRNSELQFRKDMLENYQSQVTQLRSTNQQKTKKIKKLQETLHELTNKSTHLQKHTTTYTNQHLLLQNKLSSLDKSNSELLSKLQLACSSVETQQSQLTSLKEKQATLRSQVKNLTIQVQEADNLIKSKNSIIMEYEKQVQEFVQKVSELEDRVDSEKVEKMEKMKRYEDEIEKLKDKLFNSPTEERRDSLSGAGYRYNSSYNNRYLSFGSKQPVQAQQRNQEIQKLQSNLIDQMNEQNSRLRSQVLQLTKKIHSLESLSRVITSMQPQSPSSKSPSRSKISNIPAERDVGLMNGNIQERLLRFNQRLETCIHDNQLIAVRDVDLTASQRIAMHEKERRQLEIKYQKEIKLLKDQVRSLEEQLANVSSQQEKLVDSGLKEFDKYEIMNEQAEKSTKEELEFLRSKLNDHQKTNSSLIKLNEHLKRQLQESLQKGLHSTTEYYKLQWRETEKSLQQEKQKTRKLQDQNNRLKHENLQRDSKLIKEYELKFFNIEEKLTTLERENTCLKMIRNKNDNEKANYQHDIHVYTADIEAIKASNNAKIAQYEKVIKELKDKCNSMEKDLYEVNNSLKWGAMNGISRTVLTNEKPGSSSRRVLA